MTNYQRRMKYFIAGAVVYLIAAWVGLSYFDLALGWLVVFSTCAILCSLAVGFDAVYDSLQERLPHR
jgi:hypothetical protein